MIKWESSRLASLMLSVAMVILLVSAASKLATFWLGLSLLRGFDPLLYISNRTVMVAGSALEIVAVAAMFSLSQPFYNAVIVSLLGAEFLFYHAMLRAVGYTGPCGCLGGAWRWLGVSDQTMTHVAIWLAASLFLIGASMCCLEWRRRDPNP
jgi:hypothetical protein